MDDRNPSRGVMPHTIMGTLVYITASGYLIYSDYCPDCAEVHKVRADPRPGNRYIYSITDEEEILAIGDNLPKALAKAEEVLSKRALGVNAPGGDA